MTYATQLEQHLLNKGVGIVITPMNVVGCNIVLDLRAAHDLGRIDRWWNLASDASLVQPPGKEVTHQLTFKDMLRCTQG
jgi:hypothetical protein